MPDDTWQQQARYLVNGNRERYPELLVEQLASAMRAEAKAMSVAEYSRLMAVVALRMLHRAGKLKPTTDDERAALKLCEFEMGLPAANRRIGHPLLEDYVGAVAEAGQRTLFDTSSQESVNEEEAA
jgi:hypothetical protein